MTVFKRWVSAVVVVCCLQFSVPSLGVRASAVGETFSASDFTVECYYLPSGGNILTDLVAVPIGGSDGIAVSVVDDFYRYEFPASVPGNAMRFVNMHTLSDVRIDHEYHLNFVYKIYYNYDCNVNVDVQIFNSNGTIYKAKELYSASFSGTSNTLNHDGVTCDLNFKLLDSDIPEGGYTCKLYISFNGTPYGPNDNNIYDRYFMISELVTFEDLTDTSGLIDGIVEWIKSLYYNIAGGGPEELPSLWQRIVSGVSASISNMRDAITSGLTTLKNSVSEKIDAIQAWFSALGDRIGVFFTDLYNDIRALFIPSEGFFDDLLSDTKQQLDESLGFISDISGLFSDMIDGLKSVIQSGSSVITLPRAAITLAGSTIVLWESVQFDFNEILTIPAVSNLYNVYKSILVIILCGALLFLIHRVYDETFGSGGAGT